MSRFIVLNALFTVFCAVFFAGCGDSPEVPPATYGTVLKTLPVIAAAGEPFHFPFDDTTDHNRCKFDPETGELIKDKEE
ncbi:MAG: hypothetical protein LBT46_14690 [Planctomycetaceae bacterium]|jgi:hypothetical protein|nr:hypothetical protein [Planctomycetaceae bacterium]